MTSETIESTSGGITFGTEASNAFQRYVKKFVSGSYLLFFAVAIAMIWANLFPHAYHAFWHTELAISVGPFHIGRSVAHWIDEALMALFFFTVGLEIKREILVGGLSTPRRAVLPIAAAAGGILLPTAIYMMFNYNTSTVDGWGIPMATDIAFSLAVLALLKDRIPQGLRIFLTAFAIADDLGAVLVIAFFYTAAIQWTYLLIAVVFLLLLLAANLLWIRQSLIYAVLGMGMWFAILGSGIHATVAGVIVAMFIPAKARYDTDIFVRNLKRYMEEITCESDSCGNSILLNRRHLNAVQSIDLACRDVETPLQRLEHALVPWISYGVLPLFAMANTGLALKEIDWTQSIGHPLTLGVILGLVLGKPVGISLGTFLASRLFNASLFAGVTWPLIIGTSFLGGIGFTMSLFISGLSFADQQLIDYSKIGIILGSMISAAVGLVVLGLATRKS